MTEPRMSKKRRRETGNAHSQNAEIFEDLAHEHEEVRLQATKRLLLSISDDKNSSRSDVETIVKRLIRGLCSARKAARIGFAIALTELLVRLWGPDATQGEKLQLSVSDILTIVEEQTEIAGNATTAEVKDHYFGRVFAEEAVIKSAVLFQDRVDSDQWTRVLDIVFSLAQKKSWLREPCGWALYQAVDIIKQQLNAKRYVKALVKRLPQDGFSNTAGGVAIWLKCLHLDVGVKMPKKIWKKKNPLHPKEINRLSAALIESSLKDEPTEDKKAFKAQGKWSSNVHFAWTEVIDYLLTPSQQPKLEDIKEISFEKFWVTVVDESFFGTSSSEERKYSGYLLFQQTIQKTNHDQTLALFMENFLRCLVNHSTTSEHTLYSMAQRTLSSMTSKADKDPSSTAALIQGLLRAIHHTKFDKLLKTKQMDKLITKVESAPLRAILSAADLSILAPRLADEGLAAARRMSIADALVATFRSRSVQKDWQPDEDSPEFCIFLMLLLHSSFRSTMTIDGIEVAPFPPISADSRKLFATRLASCMTTILTQTKDPLQFFNNILKAIDSLEIKYGSGKIECVSSAIALSEIEKAQAYRTGVTTTEARSSDGSISKALDLLNAVSTIQAYTDDEDAVNLLSETTECAKAIKSSEGNEISERIIEVLLTLVSKPSVFGRKLVSQVFPHCTSSVTKEGLNTLLKVLDTAENLTGQTELFEGADEVLTNGEIEEGEADAEMVDVEDASSSSSGDVDDSSVEEEDESTDNQEELASFNAKLAEALGTRPGEEDVDAAEGTGSDDDMDDEQMEALDATLEKVFRERIKVTKNKNQGKEAKQNVVLFKKSVLDLLGIYVKNEYSNGLCVYIILPLLHSLRRTRDKGVSEKTLNLLRDYNKHYKLKDRLSNYDNVQLSTVLEDVHAEALQSDDAHVFQSACSLASQLVAKMLLANAGSETEAVVKEIIDVYARSQCSYLQDGKSKVRPAFFTDWVNWMVSNRKALIHTAAPKITGDDENTAPKINSDDDTAPKTNGDLTAPKTNGDHELDHPMGGLEPSDS